MLFRLISSRPVLSFFHVFRSTICLSVSVRGQACHDCRPIRQTDRKVGRLCEIRDARERRGRNEQRKKRGERVRVHVRKEGRERERDEEMRALRLSL